MRSISLKERQAKEKYFLKVSKLVPNTFKKPQIYFDGEFYLLKLYTPISSAINYLYRCPFHLGFETKYRGEVGRAIREAPMYENLRLRSADLYTEGSNKPSQETYKEPKRVDLSDETIAIKKESNKLSHLGQMIHNGTDLSYLEATPQILYKKTISDLKDPDISGIYKGYCFKGKPDKLKFDGKECKVLEVTELKSSKLGGIRQDYWDTLDLYCYFISKSLKSLDFKATLEVIPMEDKLPKIVKTRQYNSEAIERSERVLNRVINFYNRYKHDPVLTDCKYCIYRRACLFYPKDSIIIEPD